MIPETRYALPVRVIVPDAEFFTVHRYRIEYDDGTSRAFASLLLAALSAVEDKEDVLDSETGIWTDLGACRQICREKR